MTVSEAEVAAQPGLGVLVLRALGVAALVIAASATLFWSVGRGADDGLLVADGPGDEAAAGEDDPAAGGAGDDPEPEEPAGPAEPEEPAEPGEPADPEEPAEPDGSEESTEETDPEPDPDPQEPEEPSEPDDPDRIDPSTVSVQVLDGYQADGGAAAAAVADELAAEGYRIIARNPAIPYAVTTVLWTAGSQAAAEQVARDIGATEVREQPGNLADSVMVHVVVGADRG